MTTCCLSMITVCLQGWDVSGEQRKRSGSLQVSFLHRYNWYFNLLTGIISILICIKYVLIYHLLQDLQPLVI